MHVDSTKEDMHLLGQLCMTMHVREGNSDRMFEVKNADCPPSLSEHGVLRSGQKSDLLSCLEVYCPSDFDEADGKLIDGAHMVHVLRPDANIKSFRHYTDKKVIQYIETQLANTNNCWCHMGPQSARRFISNHQREEGSRNQTADDATRWEWKISEKLEPICRTQATRWNGYIICQ